MTANELVTKEDLAYAVSVRRAIHEYPELGFELPRTTALVKQELDRLGIALREDYAPCSISGYIGSGARTLGIRADMDALPIDEKTGLPYASRIPGRMHACGHDAHTAILLTVARVLKRNEEKLPVRVKLLFQPSEECEVSGARAMLESGAMEDVDVIIGAHCENTLESGRIGYFPGDYMAACDPITITFRGKTAHATMAENGVDAIAMAYAAVAEMKQLVKTIARDRMHVFSLGYFHGGTAHNVIADCCTLKISFRYYDMAMAAEIREACASACERIAAAYGGSVDIDWQMSAPSLHNDEALTEAFRACAEEVLPGRLTEMTAKKSTEDFAWFLTKRPGFLFRFGTRNEAKGCVRAQHCNDFELDEDAMMSAILAFVQFALSME